MKRLLYIDAAINLGLGVLLVPFPVGVAEWIGLPIPDHLFYARILGGVLFGIGIALLIEVRRSEGSFVGLGLGGAVAINLCGGGVLIFFLLFGDLGLSIQGTVFLWALAIVLVVISLFELGAYFPGREPG